MTEEISEVEVEELHEQYLMDTVRKAETLVADFISEANELLRAVEGTDYQYYECFDELITALNAMAGAFRWHKGHPKESGEVLALSRYGTLYLIRWSERHGMWNCFDEDDTPDHGISDSEFVGYFDIPDFDGYVRMADDD